MLGRFIQTLLFVCIPFSASKATVTDTTYDYPVVLITRVYHPTPSTTTVEFTQEVVVINGTFGGGGTTGFPAVPTLAVGLTNTPNQVGFNITAQHYGSRGPLSTKRTYSDHAMSLYQGRGQTYSSFTFRNISKGKYVRFVAYGLDFTDSTGGLGSAFSWPPEVVRYYTDTQPPIPDSVCFFTQNDITIKHNIQLNAAGSLSKETGIVNVECSDAATLRVSINPQTIELAPGVKSVVSSPKGNVLQMNTGVQEMLIDSQVTVDAGVTPNSYKGSTVVTIDIE